MSRRSAIFAQVRPSARRAAILEASTNFLGRPSCFPLARAFRSPAFTLSTMSDRSNSATAPSTVNIILPVGVVVSICSDIVAPGGGVRWLWERTFPLRDDSGLLKQIAGLTEDTTDFKHIEEALRHAQSGLEERVAQRTAELA